MPLTTEKDLERICNNCGQEHNKEFKSEWDQTTIRAHYKIKECEHCGYEISFQTIEGTDD